MAQDNIFSYFQTLVGSLVRGLLWQRMVCHLQLLLVLSSSHSQVQALWDLWPYFTVPGMRLLQPGGFDRHIHISQKQGGPVIPTGTLVPFYRLLRLPGTSSNRIITVTSRSTELSTIIHISVKVAFLPFVWPIIPNQQCWPNTSNLWVFPTWIYPVSSVLSKTT
jgi:hypothetical protein